MEGVRRVRDFRDAGIILPVALPRNFDRLPVRLSGSLTLECLIPVRVALLSKDCFGWKTDSLRLGDPSRFSRCCELALVHESRDVHQKRSLENKGLSWCMN